jgi:hypothetical protein
MLTPATQPTDGLRDSENPSLALGYSQRNTFAESAV